MVRVVAAIAKDEAEVVPSLRQRGPARAFFDACETGRGWAECSGFCRPNATFAAQAEPLAEMQTLAEYTDWMKGMSALLPDASYAVKSLAVDPDRG